MLKQELDAAVGSAYSQGSRNNSLKKNQSVSPLAKAAALTGKLEVRYVIQWIVIAITTKQLISIDVLKLQTLVACQKCPD